MTLHITGRRNTQTAEPTDVPDDGNALWRKNSMCSYIPPIDRFPQKYFEKINIK